MCWVNYLSTDSKTYTLLTSVQNDANHADNADDANNYNRVIGIAQLKAFSCAKNRDSIGSLDYVPIEPTRHKQIYQKKQNVALKTKLMQKRHIYCDNKNKARHSDLNEPNLLQKDITN